MDCSTLALHAQHPRVIYAVIEQPPGEVFRLRYEPGTGEFVRTESLSLAHARGYRGVYGWIAGTGVPPGLHHDVFVLTDQHLSPGDVVVCSLCGMFKRSDGDHKFVALAADLLEKGEPAELHLLSERRRTALFAVYPVVGPDEGWLGADVAARELSANPPTHD